MTGGEIVVEIGESVEPSIKPYGIGDLVNDQYEVIKEIGEGGFGIVLEVLDIKTNERLAMKVSKQIIINKKNFSLVTCAPHSVSRKEYF